MSYSLDCKCFGCVQKDKCIDSTFIQGAISGINAANWSNGVQREVHCGSGSIQINCQNFYDKKIEPCEFVDDHEPALPNGPCD